MTEKKKALLVGEYSSPDWHPLKNVDQQIISILKAGYEIYATEDYDQFLAENLKQYDLVISYVDKWKGSATSEQVAGLITYVSNGGSFLVIHNGIALQSRYELLQLIGARFTGHPPFRKIDFTVTDGEHPIMKGIDSFSMDEEPYEFELVSHHKQQILLEYTDGEKLRPAAWTHEYGLGRVVFLMPGHQVESFEHPVYRQILAQAAEWITSR